LTEVKTNACFTLRTVAHPIYSTP